MYVKLPFFLSIAFSFLLFAPPASAGGNYCHFNTVQGGTYQEGTYECTDYANDFCAEAEQKGIPCWQINITPILGGQDGHQINVVIQSQDANSITYCAVEPQTGEIVTCWTAPKIRDDPRPVFVPLDNQKTICKDNDYDPAKTICRVQDPYMSY